MRQSKREERFIITPSIGRASLYRVRLQDSDQDIEDLTFFLDDYRAEDLIFQSRSSALFRIANSRPKTLCVMRGKEKLFEEKEAVGRTPKLSDLALLRPLSKEDKGKKEKAGGKSDKPGDPTRPASNWWMLHQELEHASDAHDVASPTEEIWSSVFAQCLGITQPIVGYDKVLVGLYGNGSENFAALNRGSGVVDWTRPSNDLPVSGTPVAVNGRVYFVEWGAAGAQLVNVNIADGTENWVEPLSAGSQSGLAAAFGNIYLLTRSGELRAFNAETGASVWTAEVDVGAGSTLSSPAIGFGNVFVGTNQGMRAFDAISGEAKWITPAGSPHNGNACPIVVMDVGIGNPAMVVIGSADNTLRGYKIISGELQWEYAGDMDLWYTTPATRDGKIYLRQRRKIVELDAISGAQTSISPDLGAETGSGPTVTASSIFATMQDGRIVVLDRSDMAVADEITAAVESYGDGGHPSIEGSQMFATGYDTVLAFQ